MRDSVEFTKVGDIDAVELSAEERQRLRLIFLVMTGEGKVVPHQSLEAVRKVRGAGAGRGHPARDVETILVLLHRGSSRSRPPQQLDLRDMPDFLHADKVLQLEVAPEPTSVPRPRPAAAPAPTPASVAGPAAWNVNGQALAGTNRDLAETAANESCLRRAAELVASATDAHAALGIGNDIDIDPSCKPSSTRRRGVRLRTRPQRLSISFKATSKSISTSTSTNSNSPSNSIANVQGTASPPMATHINILASPDSATKVLFSFLKIPQKKLRTSPLFVNWTGELGYKIIGEAVQAAAPGQVVIVQPGRYCEQLVLDRDVYVVGTRDAVLEWTEDVTVDCIASARPTLRGITIRGASTNDPAVFIGRGSRAVIEDCCITTAAMSCIEVRDQDTAPTIRSNIIRDSPCNGVFVHSGAAGTIEDNDISGCRAAAVLVQGRGTAPTFRSNRIHDNRECGVWIGKHAAGEFVANEIYSNRKAALGVLLHADPLVRGNRVRDQKLGMLVFHYGRGKLVKNVFERIEDSSYAAPGVRGIEVLDGCSPIIRGTIFRV
eukprot:tig00021036_g17297.t1